MLCRAFFVMEGRMKTLYFVTLGCPKNTVDSEVMTGILLRQGYRTVDNLDEKVDVAVVNTCGFIEPAKVESIDCILELAQHKESGRIGKLVVAGCLAQRYAGELRTEIPEIDVLFGIDGIEKIDAYLEDAGSEPAVQAAPRYIYSSETPRAVSGHVPYAYIKIADGCDHKCAFCSIPAIRGPQRSRSIGDIVREAQRLTAEGFSELILVAQDGTAYGRDLGMKDGLADLLEALNGVPDIGWIRPMYMFPGRISDRLLDTIAGSEHVTPYIDLPLQHSEPHILKAMGRPFERDYYLKMMDRIRGRLSENVSIRTSLIVGFPGETDADVIRLKSFVESARFHHVGVFTYSQEEGTPAENLGDPVPESVKEERRSAIMDAQKPISAEWNEQLVDRTLPVLVEGYSEETDLLLQGRHMGQAPEIDGVVYINEGQARMGEICNVTVLEAMAYDIVGKIET